MALKVTFQFHNGGQGWSEIWYYTKSSDFSQCANDINSLPEAVITRFRHPTTVFDRIRINDVARNRRGLTIPKNIPGGSTGLPTDDSGPDITSTAAIYSVSTSGGATRRIWLRGLSDAQIYRNPDSGNIVINGTLKRQVDAYFTALRGIDFGVRYLTPITTDQFYTINTLARQANQPAYTFITWTPATALPDPGGGLPPRVIISGVDPKIAPGINGHFAVYTPAAGTGNILYQSPGSWQASPQTYNPGTKAKMRVESYNYAVLSTWGLIDYWHRDTGKASGLHRGRARAKVRRAS